MPAKSQGKAVACGVRSASCRGVARRGSALDLELMLTRKGTCRGVPMESIPQRALRDGPYPNRFLPPAAVRRARRPDNSKTAAYGVRRKPARAITTRVFQGKRISGRGMYCTRIQAGMPKSMPVRLPLPLQKSSAIKIPLPAIRLPYSPASRITLPHFSFRYNRASIGVSVFSGFREPASPRFGGRELG